MKRFGILRLFVVLILLSAGYVLKFPMGGHDYLGYICFAVALLIVLFNFLNRYSLKKLRVILIVMLCAGIVAFGIIEVPIVRAAKTDVNPGADYLVVLGAGLYGTTPSLILVSRLNAALDYLTEFPDATVIVAGGQGPGEDITEAEAMRVWLTGKGIDPSRIVKEDKSTSTVENLSNSFSILRARGGNPANGIAIVSSNFHLYRAKLIAKSLGASPVGVAGTTRYPLLNLNYFIREAFAVVYMRVFG